MASTIVAMVLQILLVISTSQSHLKPQLSFNAQSLSKQVLIKSNHSLMTRQFSRKFKMLPIKLMRATPKLMARLKMAEASKLADKT